MRNNSLKTVTAAMLEDVALRFRALGEVSRLRIVQELQGDEKSVTDLVELTGLSQPNVSRHLTVLASVGLIGRKKAGNKVLYRVIDKNLAEICGAVCASVSSRARMR